MHWKEFQEWEIFLASHPPASEVIDWQFATLFSVLVRMMATRGSATPGIEVWSLYERLRPRTPEEVSRDVKRQFGIEE